MSATRIAPSKDNRSQRFLQRPGARAGFELAGAGMFAFPGYPLQFRVKLSKSAQANLPLVYSSRMVIPLMPPRTISRNIKRGSMICSGT